MHRVALVTGADRGLGRAVVQALLEDGWTVMAGQVLDWPELTGLVARFPDRLHILPLDVSDDLQVQEAARRAADISGHIDLLVSNAAINRSHSVSSVREPLNFADMADEFSVNALGALRLVNAFLPFLDQGAMRRLCFVSSEAGSVGASRRTGWFGYCMSKAALNMAVKNMSNDLGPQGYTFRLYHPGWLRTYMSGTKNIEATLEPEDAAVIALQYFLSQDERGLVLRSFDGDDMPW